jgi:hypothetical protein
MHSTEKSVTISKGYVFYKNLLLLYPELYRKEFAEEMLLMFEDIYQETFVKQGKIDITFWLSLSFDITKNAVEQHIHLCKKQGMKKYLTKTLHINRYNIIGALLLLPFLSVFAIDIIARIAQGDVTHYNRPVYLYLSHTIFYWTPILFIWVILFPALAVLLNFVPLIQKGIKKNRLFFQLSFIKQNAVSFAILAVGMGFLAIVKLHDFAPCFVHGLVKIGITQIPRIFSVCSTI